MKTLKNAINIFLSILGSVSLVSCISDDSSHSDKSIHINGKAEYEKELIENGLINYLEKNNSDPTKSNFVPLKTSQNDLAKVLDIGQIDVVGKPGSDRVLEKVASSQYIGVIPSNVAANIEWMKMDDEDNGNTSKIVATGSIPAGLNDGDSRNTKISWTWVDGTAAGFRRLKQNDYVVIRYNVCGCPPGGIAIDYREDNEDNSNVNSKSSNTGSPNYFLDTKAYFGYCLFPSDPTNGVNSLPDLGFSYAIFAQPVGSPYWGTPYGYVYSDDEDSDNANYLSNWLFDPQACGGPIPVDAITRFKKIIEVGSNTKRWYATRAP